MYKILISFKTGDSFEMHAESDFIEIIWKSFDAVEESLSRIKNHYEFYLKNQNKYTEPKAMPVGVKWDKEFRMIMLELVNDEMEVVVYSDFWTGYFDTLLCAQIILDYAVYKPE